LERSAGRTVIAFAIGAVVGLGFGVHATGLLAKGEPEYPPPVGPGAEELAEGARIGEILERADGLAAAGKHRQAVKLYFDLLSQIPDGGWIRPSVVAKGARAKFAMGEGAEVVDFVRFALATDPRRQEKADRPIGRRGPWPVSAHELLILLGDAYLDAAAAEEEAAKKRELLESAAHAYELVPRTPFRELRATSPRYGEARLRLGRTHVKLGRPERARVVLEEIVRDFPASPEREEAARLLAEIKAAGKKEAER